MQKPNTTRGTLERRRTCGFFLPVLSAGSSGPRGVPRALGLVPLAHRLKSLRRKCAARTPEHVIKAEPQMSFTDFDANAKQQARPTGPGFGLLKTTLLYTQTLLCRRGLRHVSLERLVSLFGEIGIKLADLGRLRDEAFVGRLGVVGLDLDGLVDRLGAEKLFQ